MKYTEWFNIWLENYIKPSSKQRTYEQYCKIAKIHILPRLGNYELAESTPFVLQKFVTDLTVNGNKCTGKGLYPNFVTLIVTGVGSITCGSYSQSGRGAGWSSHSNIVDFNKIAKEFVTCSTSGNTLSINVTKSLYDYYESKETKIVEGNGETTTYTNKLYSINNDTDGNNPYFLVTFKHKTLGFSAQYKFFIGEEVSKVTPSKTTITF